ncbi:MAG: phosphate starvation-inducible protein PhoH, partial [Rikenellaceae bacterium]
MEINKKGERVFDLNGIDLLNFYGEHNSNINYISKKFPDLRITSRGEKIKVSGETAPLNIFCDNLDNLIAYFSRYGHISEVVIDQVFN